MNRTIELIKDEIKSGKILSPAYIFSERLFEERANKVKESFGEQIDICFSIKANSFLLNLLPDVFSKVEVCSPGELEICKALGISPEKIIFSGVNKGAHDVAEALRYGVGTITAESPRHFDLIKAEQKKIWDGGNESPLPVLLRMSDESQFGMDKEEIIYILKNRDNYPWLNIVGLHFFTGTQKKKTKEIQREMKRLRKFISRLYSEAEYIPSQIEYGTGLAVEYFATSPEEAEEYEMTLLHETADILKDFAENPFMSPDETGSMDSDAMPMIPDDTPKPHLTVEMGRFFSAPCGFYTTGIVDTKTNDGLNFMVVDGGAHQLKYDGQTQGMQIPLISHITADYVDRGADNTESISVSNCVEPIINDDGSSSWTIAGSLCTTADIIARNACFSEDATGSDGLPNIGDTLLFHRTGAYSVMEGTALFLSRDLPRVYFMTKDDRITLVRDRIETYTFNFN